MYCTTDDVYAVAGITSDEVSEATVTALIKDIEGDIDRYTNTTYWSSEDNGTTTSATNTTLVDSGKSWTEDAYIGDYIWITGGTGSGQFREITDNDGTSITIESAWDTNPDATSTYRIIHTGTNPKVTETRDGDGTEVLFVRHYPVRILHSVTIDSTDVTISYIHNYDDIGKLELGSSAEESNWNTDSRSNIIVYDYGVYPIPRHIKSYVAVLAAMAILSTQMGGTHNIPSTYSLPEGSVTIGQAYINIRGTFDVLTKREVELKKNIKRYPVFA